MMFSMLCLFEKKSNFIMLLNQGVDVYADPNEILTVVALCILQIVQLMTRWYAGV